MSPPKISAASKALKKESPGQETPGVPLPGTPYPISDGTPDMTLSKKKSLSRKEKAFDPHSFHMETERGHISEITASKLKNIPIATVAQIAASICHSEMSANECVAKAYDILELAAFGKGWLEKNGAEFFVSTGIGEEIRRQTRERPEAIQKNRKLQLKVQIDNLIYDGRGNPRRDNFQEVLKRLLPNKKKDERYKSFRHWLMWFRKIDIGAAGDLLKTWKKEGIPADTVHDLFNTYDEWNDSNTSKERSVSGTKSAAMRAEQKNATAAPEGKPPSAGK